MVSDSCLPSSASSASRHGKDRSGVRIEAEDAIVDSEEAPPHGGEMSPKNDDIQERDTWEGVVRDRRHHHHDAASEVSEADAGRSVWSLEAGGSGGEESGEEEAHLLHGQARAGEPPRLQAPGKQGSHHDGRDQLGAEPGATLVLVLVCSHAVSASLLLVVNSWLLRAFPYVWLVTTLQFVPTALIAGVLSLTGLAKVDRLEARQLLKFCPGAVMLFITLAAGNAVVKHTNVDTFIVLRALTPIPSAFLECCFLGEPRPKPASWLGLFVVVLGAVCYAFTDRGIAVSGASWGALFLVMMPLSGVFMRRLITACGLRTTWGLVLYKSTLAAGFGVLATAAFELSSSAAVEDLCDRLSRSGAATLWLLLLLSAVIGVVASFFQMSVRRALSSTAFMVLGVSNKLMAVFAMRLTSDAASGMASVPGIVTSIAGAVVFQQTVRGGGIAQAPAAAAPCGGAHDHEAGGSAEAEGGAPLPTKALGPRAVLATMSLGVVWAALLCAIDAGVMVRLPLSVPRHV